MRYQISGKQIKIGLSLRNYVKAELDPIIAKYAERPTDATLIFSKNASEFACEATIHLSTGLNVQAKAHNHEIYTAFDLCCDKMEKQLRRYKRRLKDHHRSRAVPVEHSEASSYILASESGDEKSEPDSLQPIIVAEMETRIPSLSVGEAVMQMQLAQAPVLVFMNDGKKSLNVVYRRDDGNIGWIDP
ncbi:MAG: ribosome-associated translation inhibitor RaiA [Roseovarius sp.]|nr:ribosome-associated translation inhibitor RaiA [Roseovarius sp.]MCY4207199.1 ribosome-associated translation inhibitor RaiA [Roseovarius sp.]MCY4290444.1 ribosome-associated translation inhibitor RaiA [Roseovarius sp.]MCY4317005.1 ribosome-associated translation inhibitor RaiA [Roseovarius sp.]